MPRYNRQCGASAFKVELLPNQTLTQFPQTISGSWVARMSEGLSDLAVGEVQPLDFCVECQRLGVILLGAWED